MNSRPLGRIVWKEWRAFRAFWLAMLLIAVVLCELLLDTVWHPLSARSTSRFHFAFVAAAFYALGCSAAMFATEHEESTYSLLRTLPLRWGEVFWSKLAMAVGSTLALLATLSALAATRMMLGGIELHSDWESAYALWGFWTPVLPEAIAWGVFFSLLTRRPAMALFLAAAALVASDMFLFSIAIEPVKKTVDPVLVLAPRLGLALVVFLIDVWLARRWYADPAEKRSGQAGASFGAGAANRTTDVPRRRMLGRLVWQCARQDAWQLATFAAVIALLLIFVTLVRGRDLDGLFALALAAIIPACVFLSDQVGERYRFFAEHGISGRDVWWSRQLVWFGFWAILSVVGLIVVGFSVGHFPLGMACLMCLAVYGAGQLSSLYVHSRILAATFAVLLSALVIGWGMLMQFLNVNLLWTLLPLPVLMLLLTRLQAPDWVIERRGWPLLRRLALVLLLPSLLLLLVVRTHRIYEVPWSRPLGDVSEDLPSSMSPAEEAVYQRYQDAVLKMSPFELPAPTRVPGPGEAEDRKEGRYPDQLTAEENAAVEKNAESIRLAIDASGDPAIASMTMGTGFADSVTRLGWLVALSGSKLQADGDLDAAWRRYLSALRIARQLEFSSEGDLGWEFEADVYRLMARWAARPGQTSDRIEKGIAEVEAVQAQSAPLSPAILRVYQRSRERILAPVAELPDYLGWLEWTGERQRALRKLNRLVRQALELAANVERAVQADQHPNLAKHLLRGELPSLLTAQYIEELATMDVKIVQRWLDAVAARRAVRIVLALEAYRADHGGNLPETLDELAGKQLKTVPLNPYTAAPFEYMPQGAWRDWVLPRTTPGFQWRVTAGEPFLWCGRRGVFMPWQPNDPRNIVVYEKGYGLLNSDRWAEAGLIFAIPTPDDRRVIDY